MESLESLGTHTHTHTGMHIQYLTTREIERKPIKYDVYMAFSHRPYGSSHIITLQHG